MKSLYLLILLFTACTQSPYPITTIAVPFKGENPYMVNLSSGQDQKPIPPNLKITITGPLEKETGWPIICGSDTGYIYPKFLEH
jgi:hypothetical protein